MRWYKKVLAVCSFCTVLTTVKCLAISDIDMKFNEDKSIYYKTYEITEEEKTDIENILEKQIEIDGNVYELSDYAFSGGDIENSININTTKTIISKTNNKESIIEQLGNSLEYEENGFKGEYILEPNSIKIKTNYNGYKEELIEENIEYKNLEKNDLSYIPKEVEKDGKILTLLNTEWIVQTNTEIGEYEVPDKYIAKCYYATKQRVDNPYTYTVTANYYGTATKIEENPILCNVEYKKQIQKQPEEIKEEKNILPVVASGTGIVIIVLFFSARNVKVYNYQDGRWVKVGKTRMINNNINLNKFVMTEKTNKYQLELSKSLVRRKKGKLITVKKKNNSLKFLVDSQDNKTYTFEVRI